MPDTPGAGRPAGLPRVPRWGPEVARRVARHAAERAGGAILRSRAADLALSHRHGPRNRRVVALTFDDGPVRGGTERVQDELARLGVVATFFCVGANAERHPELIERAIAAGHVIAAHSMWHNRLDALSLTGAAHLDRCQALLRDISGRLPALYRAPWGWLTPWEALRVRRRGLSLIAWDVYSLDANEPSPPAQAMLARTLVRVRPGSIVLCHDGYAHANARERPETVALIAALVPALRARGYDLVTVPDLLGIPAYQDWPQP